MKIIVNRAALVEALNLCGSVVLARTPKPVLTCVKLHAGETAGVKSLTLTVTDMEIALQYTLTQVDISEPGQSLIPAHKFAEIVASSPDDTLTIETNNDDRSIIKDRNSKFSVFGYPVDQFPPIDGPEGEPACVMEAAALRAMLVAVAPATSKEPSRYSSQGALLKGVGNKITAAATTGHALHVMKGDASRVGSGFSIIIPAKATSILIKLLEKQEGDTSFWVKENRTIFRIGEGIELSVSLLEGAFPDFEAVLNGTKLDKKFTANRESFLASLRRAALLTNEASMGVGLSFSKNSLVFSGRAAEEGDSEIEIPIEYDGEAMMIRVNPDILIAAFRVVGAEDLAFEMIKPGKPMTFKSGNFRFMFMTLTSN